MASLLTMGISTVVIGLLPGYESIGIVAPMLLALARFGQGLGLGGEWGGAALLATENARRASAPCTAPSTAGRADRLLLRQRHLPAALGC
nr:Inner membrane metabolite transport protein yhjE [Klebsiella pneumoniae]